MNPLTAQRAAQLAPLERRRGRGTTLLLPNSYACAHRFCTVRMRNPGSLCTARAHMQLAMSVCKTVGYCGSIPWPLMCESTQQHRALMMILPPHSMISMMLFQCPISCASEISRSCLLCFFGNPYIISPFNSWNLFIITFTCMLIIISVYVCVLQLCVEVSACLQWSSQDGGLRMTSGDLRNEEQFIL